MKCECKYELDIPEGMSSKESAYWITKLPSELQMYLLSPRSYDVKELKGLKEKYKKYFK